MRLLFHAGTISDSARPYLYMPRCGYSKLLEFLNCSDTYPAGPCMHVQFYIAISFSKNSNKLCYHE